MIETNNNLKEGTRVMIVGLPPEDDWAGVFGTIDSIFQDLGGFWYTVYSDSPNIQEPQPNLGYRYRSFRRQHLREIIQTGMKGQMVFLV